MTKRLFKRTATVAVLALLALAALTLAALPARAEGEGFSYELTLDITPEELQTDYYTKSTLSAGPAGVLPQGARVFYAVTKTEAAAEELWYQTAAWKAGAKAELPAGKYVSIAFIAAITDADAPTWQELTKDEQHGTVVTLNDRFVDYAAPTFAHANGSALATTYYTDLLLKIQNGADGSELKEVKVTRKGTAQEAAPAADDTPLPPAEFAENETERTYAAPGEIKAILSGGLVLQASSTEQQTVTVTATDAAGNTASETLTLGMVPVSTVVYTEFYNSASAGSFPKTAQNELDGFQDSLYGGTTTNPRYQKFKDALREINQAYVALDAVFNGFCGDVRQLPSLSEYPQNMDAKAAAETYAEKFAAADAKYAETLTKEMRDAAATRVDQFSKLTYADLFAAKKRDFRTKRFTQGNLTVSFKDLADTAETYRYYLTAEYKTENFGEYAKITSQADRELRETYALGFMDAASGESVAPEKFAGTAAELQITLSDAFGNDNVIAGLFKDNAFSSLPKAWKDANRVFHIELTLADGFPLLGLCTPANLNLRFFLTVGLPLIGVAVLLIAGAIVAVVIVRKRNRQPDEKLNELKTKLEQQKKVNEIAKKSKEEEERINREKQEEIERRRQEAIEKVKEERRKALEEKERLLREAAERDQSALAAAQLAEFERLAAERQRAEQERLEKEAASQKPAKKKAAKKASEPKKSASKSATKKSAKAKDAKPAEKAAKPAAKKSKAKAAGKTAAQETPVTPEAVADAAAEQPAEKAQKAPAKSKKKSTKKKLM